MGLGHLSYKQRSHANQIAIMYIKRHLFLDSTIILRIIGPYNCTINLLNQRLTMKLTAKCWVEFQNKCSKCVISYFELPFAVHSRNYKWSSKFRNNRTTYLCVSTGSVKRFCWATIILIYSALNGFTGSTEQNAACYSPIGRPLMLLLTGVFKSPLFEAGRLYW